jgi:hypothetical protein
MSDYRVKLPDGSWKSLVGPVGPPGPPGPASPDLVRVLEAPLEFHVAATGGDDDNDGSVGAPFATIQRAVDEAQRYLTRVGAEVTVHLSAGTHILTSPVAVRGVQSTGLRLVGAGWTQFKRYPRLINYDDPANPVMAEPAQPWEFAQNRSGLLSRQNVSSALWLEAQGQDIADARAELLANALTIVEMGPGVDPAFTVEGGSLAIDQLLLLGSGSGSGIFCSPVSGVVELGPWLHIHGFTNGVWCANARSYVYLLGAAAAVTGPAPVDYAANEVAPVSVRVSSGTAISGCAVGLASVNMAHVSLWQMAISLCSSFGIRLEGSALVNAHISSCRTGIQSTRGVLHVIGEFNNILQSALSLRQASTATSVWASLSLHGCGFNQWFAVAVGDHSRLWLQAGLFVGCRHGILAELGGQVAGDQIIFSQMLSACMVATSGGQLYAVTHFGFLVNNLPDDGTPPAHVRANSGGRIQIPVARLSGALCVPEHGAPVADDGSWIGDESPGLNAGPRSTLPDQVQAALLTLKTNGITPAGMRRALWLAVANGDHMELTAIENAITAAAAGHGVPYAEVAAALGH